MRQTDQKAMGNLYTDFYIYRLLLAWDRLDFFNIIQAVCDTEWIIASDEAHDKDILRLKILAELLKIVSTLLFRLQYVHRYRHLWYGVRTAGHFREP